MLFIQYLFPLIRLRYVHACEYNRNDRSWNFQSKWFLPILILLLLLFFYNASAYEIWKLEKGKRKKEKGRFRRLFFHHRKKNGCDCLVVKIVFVKINFQNSRMFAWVDSEVV